MRDIRRIQSENTFTIKLSSMKDRTERQIQHET